MLCCLPIHVCRCIGRCTLSIQHSLIHPSIRPASRSIRLQKTTTTKKVNSTRKFNQSPILSYSMYFGFVLLFFVIFFSSLSNKGGRGREELRNDRNEMFKNDEVHQVHFNGRRSQVALLLLREDDFKSSSLLEKTI